MSIELTIIYRISVFLINGCRSSVYMTIVYHISLQLINVTVFRCSEQCLSYFGILDHCLSHFTYNQYLSSLYLTSGKMYTCIQGVYRKR